MKSIFTLLIAISFANVGIAQPVLSNVVPNFGDQFVLTLVGSDPAPGEAGANITWDFSDETISGFSYNYSVVTTDQVDESADYPDASMVWLVDVDDDVFLNSFMSFENSTYAEYGNLAVGSGDPVGTAYSNPVDHFTYPLAYQDSGSDDFSGSVLGFSNLDSIWGTESYIVDGYGTVITPFGSYENVLRVTSNNTNTQTIIAIGAEVVTNTIITRWFSPDYPVPVLILSRVLGTVEEPEESISMSALANYTPSTTGLINSKNPNTFEVYPNPASDYITVTFDKVKGNSVLNIYSSTGKLVDSKDIQTDQNLDISDLATGIYIAVLNVDGQRYAQKPFNVSK